jgi:hypothetical protein
VQDCRLPLKAIATPRPFVGTELTAEDLGLVHRAPAVVAQREVAQRLAIIRLEGGRLDCCYLQADVAGEIND